MDGRWRRRSRLLGCVVLAAALLPTGPASPADAPAPSAPTWTLAGALSVARKAPRGDKAAVQALASALAASSARADEARAAAAGGWNASRPFVPFATQWNDAVTTLAFHGGRSVPKYVLYRVTTFRDAGLALSFPLSARWSYEYKDATQHILSIVQTCPSGGTLAEVKVWFYRWDTVYSGVGGENYVKLARVMHELDVEAMAGSKRRVSPRVIAMPLNAAFPRVQHYFVEGYDALDEMPLRRRNYYLKDDQRTYNVELIERTDASADPDPVLSWQRTDDCPERKALLASIASVPKK